MSVYIHEINLINKRNYKRIRTAVSFRIVKSLKNDILPICF